MSQAQSTMGAENYEKFRNFIKQKESGGNYIPISDSQRQADGLNRFGYAGAYQFGAEALQSQGLIRQGIITNYSQLGKAGHNAVMLDSSNWTNGGGLQKFLNDPVAQDKAFDRLVDQNFRTLSKAGVIKPNDPPDVVAGYLASAHLKGAGSIIKNGVSGVDANNTSAESYFKGAAKAVNGTSEAIPPAGRTGSAPQQASTAPEKRERYNGAGVALKDSAFGNSVTIGGSILQSQKIPLPQVNPLSKFSSFNCVFTLSNISADSHRNPLTTYKKGDLGQIILRSAGAGSRAQSTAMTSKDNPTGQYDFFIDNVDIASIITYNPKTKGSNATDISFDVIEPYSMGIFMQACEIAAKNNGWTGGHLRSVYLLTIEFIGYDDNGNPVVIPNTTRNIPMTFKDISMTAKANGAVYRVKGHPANEIPLDNNHRLFDVDVAISGKTVQEVLQTGDFSLQTILNKRLQEFAAKEKEPTLADEIVIVFPKLEDLGTPAENKDTGATSKVTSVIKVDRKTSSSNLIQSSDTLNELGLSEMDFTLATAGESRVNKDNEVQEDPSKPINRSKVVYDEKTRQFIYSQGTSIVNAITSVMLNSKYCKNALAEQKTNNAGFINWFRIETAVDYQKPKTGNLGNNSQPKLLIFKVVPYQVHSAKNTAPTAPVKGYANLRNEVAKVYDYIYTGKNTEIINFDLEFKQAFFNTIARDSGKQHRELFNTGQGSATTDSQTAPKTPDNTPKVQENLPGQEVQGRNLNAPADSAGGTRAEDHKSNVAKRFQEALYESTTDLVMANVTIMGDPYYLADSGLGNFSNSGSGRFNITSTGAMDYQSGEVDIIINFRTPLDYNQQTGIMDFGNTDIVEEFSGLYKVNFVTNRWQKGKFTQELQLMRRPKQTAKPINSIEAKQIANGYNKDGYAMGLPVVDDTGAVNPNIRKDPDTGELYTISDGRATANPRNAETANKATRVTSARSTTPNMTDADNKSVFNGYP